MALASTPQTSTPQTSGRLHHGDLDTISAIPAFHAARRPEVSAIICAGATLSYADLHRLSNQIAQALRADGINPGDRVAYLGQESVYYYATIFGCAKAGAVLVPVNFRLAAPEIDHILRDSDSRLLIIDPDLAPAIERLREALPQLPVRGSTAADFTAWTSELPDQDLDHPVTAQDPVFQLYTSGTTGWPKGVVLAHRSFFAVRNALAAADLDWIDWYESDRSLIGIPGFHIGGLWWSMQGFSAGITNLAMPRFDSSTAVRLIAELAVTTVCVVPAMLRLLLIEPGVDRATFSSLRKVVYGGSPISTTLLTVAMPVLDCEFAQIYGLTETGNTAVCLPPADHWIGSPRLRAAGRPYPGIEIITIDEFGQKLPVGVVGEVCLRTPARMLEYWGAPEATARTLREGWIHTGDAGHLDADGYVYLSDRLTDLVVVAGENIYPTEIENVLAAHPAVADTAVIGIPDEAFGEAVHAFVAVRPGDAVSPRELLLFCKERLASFKIPARFEFVQEIPRNASGKILRRQLREKFWVGRDRQVN